MIDDNDLVVSDRIIFSNIAYGVRNQSNKVYMPYRGVGPITNHFQKSSPLIKDNKNDFFLIGELNDISYLSKNFQSRLIKEFDVPFSSNNLKFYEIIFK